MVKKKRAKSGKKPAKKLKSKVSSKKKSLSKKTSKKKKSKKAIKHPSFEVDGVLIGKVTHYFSKVGAAVVEVTHNQLKVGDKILIKGHTTHIEQNVESMQVNHLSVPIAKKGDEIGLQINDRAREHDLVYRVN